MRLVLAAACLALTATAGCAAVAPTAFDLHAGDYARLRGEYALADGHAIHIAGTRAHPRIEFDDGTAQPLVPLSATEFATPDGCTRVLFERSPNATVTRLSVTRPRACTAT